VEVEKFKFIFEGLDIAYGQHQPSGSRADGKQEGQSSVVRKEVMMNSGKNTSRVRVRLLGLFLLGLIILLSGDALILMIILLITIVLLSKSEN